MTSSARHPAQPARLVRTAEVEARDPAAGTKLAQMLGAGGLDTVLLFASPEADVPALLRKAGQGLPGTRIVGCTTAGEIAARGYAEGGILGIGLPSALFRSRSIVMPRLDDIATGALLRDVLRARTALSAEVPGWQHEFAFLLVDGMSLREEDVAARVAAALGPTPFFGGSAGDMGRFRATRIIADGRAMEGAAVLLIVRTLCPVQVFHTDHFTPTARRMVVTRADPERRVVTEINGAPAAGEFARLLGKDPGQLDRMVFASHPVVVRIGGQHHVRSIREVAPSGEIHFFSAIGEGLVLTLAEPQDMATHLDGVLTGLARDGVVPDTVLACDCILRRVEAEQTQVAGALSGILARHRVLGFNTYGEQHGAMHVNQTFTGVALYPPAEAVE